MHGIILAKLFSRISAPCNCNDTRNQWKIKRSIIDVCKGSPKIWRNRFFLQNSWIIKPSGFFIIIFNFFYQLFSCPKADSGQQMMWHLHSSSVHQSSRFAWSDLKVASSLATSTAKKWSFSIKDFFSKCDKIYRKLRIWSHLLKKTLMWNFIFCAVEVGSKGPSWGISKIPKENRQILSERISHLCHYMFPWFKTLD